MHEFSAGAKRLLDTITAVFFAGAAWMTLDRAAAMVTIAAGLVSIACGCVRLGEWWARRRVVRAG